LFRNSLNVHVNSSVIARVRAHASVLLLCRQNVVVKDEITKINNNVVEKSAFVATWVASLDRCIHHSQRFTRVSAAAGGVAIATNEYVAPGCHVTLSCFTGHCTGRWRPRASEWTNNNT